MPGYLDPRTGITWGWADAENNWGGAMNKSLQDLAYIGTHPLVQNTRQSTPPTNPMPGDMYIVGANPTGLWATVVANSVVVWGRDPTQAYRTFVWITLTPKEGWVVYSASDNKLFAYNGTTWDLASAVSALSLIHI